MLAKARENAKKDDVSNVSGNPWEGTQRAAPEPRRDAERMRIRAERLTGMASHGWMFGFHNLPRKTMP